MKKPGKTTRTFTGGSQLKPLDAERLGDLETRLSSAARDLKVEIDRDGPITGRLRARNGVGANMGEVEGKSELPKTRARTHRPIGIVRA
jgi:hypothetical protein